MNADRNLPDGLLALQLNFVERHQLVAVFDRWRRRRCRCLRRALSADGR
jgi:hypothetical protein